MSEDFELLFFDTFAQTDGHEGPNLGLVQFPNPIIIKEIRVIPLGARVEADFPGGLRLGATNPSSFELEFFINDLTRRNACTFLDIGSLDYNQNQNIKFAPKELIPTDGLILRGMYSTLTLSVFGCIADISSIIALDPNQSSNAISEPIPEEQTSIDFTEDSQIEKSDENICDKIEDRMQLSQNIQSLIETSEESTKRRDLTTVLQKNESRESRLSSPCSDKCERKRKDRPLESVPRNSHRPREGSHRSRRSPIGSNASKHHRSHSRSKTKSKSRSVSPNSSKRFRYSRRTPSSPFDKSDRSPKRHYRSPRRHRSRTPSPRSPIYVNKVVSRSPLSPPSRPLSRSRNRSLTKSPLVTISNKCESKEMNESLKTEVKPIVENLTFDDSELFEPLSPEDSLSEIAEKISDDENLDQILGEEEEHSGSQSKDGFEEISSEEEYEDDGNADTDLLMDYSDYELGAYADFGAFNPFQCEFNSLQTLRDPSLSVYEMSETTENSFDSENQLKVFDLVKSFRTERNDKWVEAVEQISLEIHKTIIKDNSIIDTLIDFVVEGTDFERAMKQTNTAYKVRHLKAGIKLLTALSQTSDEILKQLIDLNLSHTLLELYSRSYMTIPVRLLVIRCIDVMCDSPIGVEHLFTHTYQWSSNESEAPKQTCYQRLLDILMEKPSTRLVVSLTCLLKKIHLLEVIKFVGTATQETTGQSSSEDSIAICLNEISLTYRNANNLLSQPLRSLPATKQFELKSSPFDSYKAIYKYFKHNNIVECLTNIISGKTNCSSETFDSVLDLLNSMSNLSHGLRFLLSSDTINSTNNLHKVLIQQCDDSESQAQTIGLKLIYRLQVLQLVDMIFGFHSTQERSMSPITKENFDDPDLVVTLHSLYTMLFTGIGRDAVVHVLSSENNFDSILPFISTDGEKRKEALISKSVSSGCALELCLVTLQLIDTNVIPFLDSYGQTLLKICENESHPKLLSISNWLSPIKNGSYNVYNENTFKSLISVVKRHYEVNSDSENAFAISPELITALKILQSLCAPTELSSSETDIELKHRYALIQIYSLDGLSQMVFLLNKLSETYLKPSHQSFALIGSQGSLVVNFIKPTVLIMKSILTYLVSSRTVDFRDVSPIAVLLRVYSVLALVPTSTTHLLNASIAQQIQFEICEILLIYTELYISGTETDEDINKSVWTKMAKHVIDYTLSSPLTFVHGLSLLSDVLPQPLPLLVKQPMLSHEVIKTVNFRKLWSLHLHVLAEHIDSLVSSLITSNSQPIQVLLRRVCVQLCDLSAPTVNIVCKSIFEALLKNIETFVYLTNDSRNVVVCPTVRILSAILDLSANTPFRFGFLELLANGIVKENKNGNILSRLQSVLNKLIATNSQIESINLILQPIPDSDVLTSETTNANTTEPNKSENITNELNVSNAESLSEYFSNRPVFVLEDDPLVPDWVSVANDDSEQMDYSDSNKIDLLDLSVKYFGTEFDIRSKIEKLWTEPMIEMQTKENDVLEKTNSLPFIRSGPKEPMAINKRIQAPRGRGRMFTRINDPFRSRPPNTSRPPSMHVDDFVALERNDGSKRQNKDFIRPNRGTNASMRSFGPNHPNQHQVNNTYRPVPSNARNIDRYNPRDMNSLSNRINKNENFPLRWTRVSGNPRNDYRNQYSRTFPR